MGTVTKYDNDEQIKISKKWFMEVGWELFNADPSDPKSIYFESKVQKMANRQEYSKKFIPIDQ